MRYVAREIPENFNVSGVHPLREFVILLSGLLGIILLVYLSLGYMLDRLIDKMPARFEETLAKLFEGSHRYVTAPRPEEQRLQDILSGLMAVNPVPTGPPIRVQMVQEKTINALALPGRKIVVFSALVDEVKTENEMAMILGHEMGHFQNQDHLRGLGRSAVLAFFSAFLFGQDSFLTNIMMDALITAELKYSREQEITADRFALELLNRRYGHVGGALDFFERLSQKEHSPKFMAFFSTHPDYTQRLEFLKARIRKKNYSIEHQEPFAVEEINTGEQTLGAGPSMIGPQNP